MGLDIMEAYVITGHTTSTGGITRGQVTMAMMAFKVGIENVVCFYGVVECLLLGVEDYRFKSVD